MSEYTKHCKFQSPRTNRSHASGTFQQSYQNRSCSECLYDEQLTFIAGQLKSPLLFLITLKIIISWFIYTHRITFYPYSPLFDKLATHNLCTMCFADLQKYQILHNMFFDGHMHIGCEWQGQISSSLVSTCPESLSILLCQQVWRLMLLRRRMLPDTEQGGPGSRYAYWV